MPFTLIALIQFPVLMGILYKIGIPSTFEKVTIKNVLVYLAFTMIAIFMSMPSKEFVTFLYLSAIVFLFQKKLFSFQKTLFISLSLFVFFGAIYRPYFALLPIVAMGMYWVTCIKISNRTFATLFYGIALIIFLSLSYGFVQGQFFSEQSRELINNARMGSVDANSSIVSPVKADTWYGEIIGILYGFFTVNVPLNGLKHIFFSTDCIVCNLAVIPILYFISSIGSLYKRQERICVRVVDTSFCVFFFYTSRRFRTRFRIGHSSQNGGFPFNLLCSLL